MAHHADPVVSRHVPTLCWYLIRNFLLGVAAACIWHVWIAPWF